MVKNENRCFRGVHDDLISTGEVEQTLRLANFLILNGADHFDIHYDISHLEVTIPSIVQKLRDLLDSRYGRRDMNPAAFRIIATGPMDFVGVNLYQKAALALNQTVSRNGVREDLPELCSL